MRTRSILAALALTISGLLHADRENVPLALHLPCDGLASCLELSQKDGQRFNVLESPALTLTPEKVAEAFLVPGEGGRGAVFIKLSPEASQEFESLTRANVGKVLAIVAADRVILAPLIKEAIGEGKLTIDPGVHGDLGFLADIPWLDQKTQERPNDSKKMSLTQWLALAMLGASLLIGGGIIFFTFRHTRTS